MTPDEIIVRLFDLSERLETRASTILGDPERDEHSIAAACVLQIVSDEIIAVFADIVKCDGEA